MMKNEEIIYQIEEMAYQIRRLSVEMITYGKWGHIGGSLSMAEILSVLYFKHLRVDPQNPGWERRDRMILSKAHGSPGLYAALALKGFYPIEKIYTYCELGGFEGHTDMTQTPGLESSGGPLGMGLSVSVGIALGLRFKEFASARSYCILGDGECNEGNVWEAAMAAAHYHLDNLMAVYACCVLLSLEEESVLTALSELRPVRGRAEVVTGKSGIIAIVDYNKVMAKGFVWDLMSIEPFAKKWRAFGWDVIEVDGHDIEALDTALYKARWVMPRGKPIVIIAHTVKGRGVELAEFNYKWHTHAPDPETADQFLRELSCRYDRPEEGYSRLNDDVEKESFYGGE